MDPFTRLFPVIIFFVIGSMTVVTVAMVTNSLILFHISRGMTSADKGIELNSPPVGMARIGKNIVVGCMDNTLRSYSTKVYSGEITRREVKP